MKKDVAVVILAGGEGMRIGGGKPLLRLGRERLVDRAVRQARGWTDVLAIAARNTSQVRGAEAGLILDVPDLAGPLAGLISGLRFARTAGANFLLTIPADMPFLPADLLDRLREAIGEFGCAIAASGGHLHPVCGFWRTSALETVARYLETGQSSLKGFAALVGFASAEWVAGPLDPFFNINTEADLADAERWLAI